MSDFRECAELATSTWLEFLRGLLLALLVIASLPDSGENPCAKPDTSY